MLPLADMTKCTTVEAGQCKWEGISVHDSSREKTIFKVVYRGGLCQRVGEFRLNGFRYEVLI